MKLQLLQQQIDYDKIITGDDLDRKTYKNKFRMWDYVKKKKLMDKTDLKAYYLLKDPTIYAYAFFKNNKGEPFKLTAYQDAIINCHHDFRYDNPNRFIIFRAANQIGKSVVLCIKALQLALTEKNVTIVMISRSLNQSQDLLRDIRSLLSTSVFADTYRDDIGEKANTTVLTFKTGSRIICAPVSEGTLGYPVHYLFLDEIDFYEDAMNFFWKVAFARTNQTKGQIICFSNPNPDLSRSASILYELWAGKLFKRKFTFNFLDAPWNTKEEYEINKRNTPSRIFVSTHGGEFPEEAGSFFTHSEIQDMMQEEWQNIALPSVDRPIYIGLDLGKMQDQTILSLGITKKPEFKDDKYFDLDVKYIEEFPLGTKYDEIAKRLVKIKEYYEQNHSGVAQIAFDATGQKTFGDFLKRQGISAFEVDFSKKETNKTLLFNDFKLMAENRKIKIVNVEKCKNQLSELIFIQTDMKKYKRPVIRARKESVHDDYCDSLAILIHIAVKPSRIPVTVKRVIEKMPDKEPIIQDTRKLVEERAIKQNRPLIYGDAFEEFRREMPQW